MERNSEREVFSAASQSHSSKRIRESIATRGRKDLMIVEQPFIQLASLSRILLFLSADTKFGSRITRSDRAGKEKIREWVGAGERSSSGLAFSSGYSPSGSRSCSLSFILFASARASERVRPRQMGIHPDKWK